MRFYGTNKKQIKILNIYISYIFYIHINTYFIAVFLQGVSLGTGSCCTVQVRGTTDALIYPNSPYYSSTKKDYGKKYIISKFFFFFSLFPKIY